MRISGLEYAVYLFGGVSKCANALNLHKSSVSRWVTRGCISDENKIKLIRVAKAKKLNLSIEDLSKTFSVPKSDLVSKNSKMWGGIYASNRIRS